MKNREFSNFKAVSRFQPTLRWSKDQDNIQKVQKE